MFEEEAEGERGAPVWIISFADMSLLLLCFMIMLLASSSQSSSTAEDMLKVLASVKVGFGYVPREGSTEPIDMAVSQILRVSSPMPVESQTRWPTAAIEGQKWKPPDLLVKEKGMIGRPILFTLDSVQISPKAQTVLDEIAEFIRHHNRNIVIQGHVSPQEVGLDPDKGHELAYRRAFAVKRALARRGIAERRLYLVSCAYFDAEKVDPLLQQRAVITLGEYFLSGSEEALMSQ